MSEWRPIETAPPDGKRVLLWCSDIMGQERVNGELVRAPVGVVFGRVDKYRDLPPKAWGDGMNGDWTFTHWMPLPDAPEAPPPLDRP